MKGKVGKVTADFYSEPECVVLENSLAFKSMCVCVCVYFPSGKCQYFPGWDMCRVTDTGPAHNVLRQSSTLPRQFNWKVSRGLLLKMEVSYSSSVHVNEDSAQHLVPCKSSQGLLEIVNCMLN